METSTRTCLHCVLERVLNAENATDAAPRVQHRQYEVVWLPEPGGRVYRRLRHLIASAHAQATERPLKVSVLSNLHGKSHVEVVVTFRAGRRWRVLSSSFPRHVASTLWTGFGEGVPEPESPAPAEQAGYGA